MTPPALRVRVIFDAVQWLLLGVAGAVATFGVAKAFRHRHDIVLAVNGGDWIDNGWYFLSMGVTGLCMSAVVLGFALVQWRRGASYPAPIALAVGANAAAAIGEDLGHMAGKVFERTDKVPFLLAHNWFPAAGGIAVVALCLYATWRFAWRAPGAATTLN